MKRPSAKGPATTRRNGRPLRAGRASRRPTLSAPVLLQDLAAILAERSTFGRVWFKRELDPRFRELVMLAVARQNDSRYCSWAHHEWASIAGASDTELTDIEQMNPAGFDARTWLAISFARELVSARFDKVPGALMRKMRASYSEEEIEGITLVAKVMDFANRGSNTFDAMLSRLGGKPSPHGRIIDELVLSGVVLAAMPPLLTYFSLASNSNLLDVIRRMLDYTQAMQIESEQAGHEPARQPRRRNPGSRRRSAGQKMLAA